MAGNGIDNTRYMTHGSWVILWPLQLIFMRLQDLSTPLPTFWRRHVQLLRQTALMVQHQTLHPSIRQSQTSPVRYMLRMTAFITCALTVAGGSWYLAVNMTTASDLTAIYNCSAFFAYAFSIPLLKEKVRLNKIIAVAIAIFGVFIVAYGDTTPAKHGNKSGGGAGGGKAPPSHEAENRTVGNMIIGIGSVLYGFYEVLYKRLACPPEGCSPNRGMVFANTFGSLIGAFTLCILWIPIPILHYMGWEVFELPRGEQAWMMAISVFANASTYSCACYSRKRANVMTSVLWVFPHLDQLNESGPVLSRRSPHHFHRGHRRPATPSAAEFASHASCTGWWPAHHRCVLSVELGDVLGDGRGKAEEIRRGKRCRRVNMDNWDWRMFQHFRGTVPQLEAGYAGSGRSSCSA